MLGRSYLTYFVSSLAVLGPVLAAEVYRVDNRPPVEVQQDGGLLSYNPGGDGSVIDHVKNLLGPSDPWVSTTTDYNVAKGGATMPGNIYGTSTTSTYRASMQLTLFKRSRRRKKITLIPARKKLQSRTLFLGITSLNGIHTGGAS